ncbi:hypothetical protein F7734_30345 [Scytonema sp. UIC 10036]|uniref:hypothetical protein n=1 Tax=Scytonema sp. UIC 10036 TaxID=2304196 RepID=UPI0012DA0CE1|nr:hypothetical protein [Scytonema sp. UIC 10036]MUG96416.1 hypothetical protein [Scytonema sp. UIC 10036]
MDSTFLMEVIEQTPDSLKLGRKVSRWLRIIFVLVAGIGLLFLIAGWRLEPTDGNSIVSPTYSHIPQMFKGILIAIGSVCVIASLLMKVMICPLITCTFDKTSGNLIIEYSATNIVHQPVAEIVDAFVEAWDDTYRVNLFLASNESLPLTYIYSSGQRDKQQLVKSIRRFLALEDANSTNS